MPGRPHHSAKMKDCVEKVMADGKDESSAYAICTTSLEKAGTPIFEDLEAGSEEEKAALETLGGSGSGNFGHKGRPGEVGGSGSGSGSGSGGEGGGKGEPATIEEIAKYGRNVPADVVNEARRRHKEETGIEVDGQGKPLPVSGSTKFSRQEIDSVDSMASHGFDSVSSTDLKKASVEDVESQLKESIKQSNILAEKAATSSGATRSTYLKQSAEHYGRAQKLSNIVSKKGGKNIPVYAPWFRFLEGEEMGEVRNLHLLGATGKSRKGRYDGKDHIVVPVVALMEGVIHAVNAPTAEFVPISALATAPQGWNGRPLMYGHPSKNGRQISANDPEVLESNSFGKVFNAHLDGKKLVAEAWIDPVKLNAIGGAKMLERIEQGGMIEVSVGAFVTTEESVGTHNGKPYKAQWKDVVPDHLAFLENKKGACSTEMGCGCPRFAMMVEAEDFRDATEAELTAAEEAPLEDLGGKGSGDFGHKGRPGEIGGSGGAGGDAPDLRGEGPRGNPKAINEKIKTALAGMSRGAGEMTATQHDDLYRLHKQAVKAAKSHAAQKAHEEAAVSHHYASDMHYGVSEDAYGSDQAREATRAAKAASKVAMRTAEIEISYLGTLEGQSYDERIQAVTDAVYKKFDNSQAAQVMPSGAWPQMIYDDHVIIRKDNKLFSVPYTVDSEGKVQLSEITTEVKMAYVAAAGKMIDCPTCDGSGNKDGNPCPTCDGAGEVKAYEQKADENKEVQEVEVATSQTIDPATETPVIEVAAKQETEVKAACSCERKKGMTPEQKKEVITSLVANKHSGFTAGDEAMLTAASDERLEAFMVAASAREKEVKAAAEAAAQPKTLTTEDFMRVAPPEIKSLITRTQRAETERKAELVAGLKAAQSEFSESELSAMRLEDLERYARLAKIEADEMPANYMGRAIPRAAAGRQADDNVFTNPPDPYEAGIKALQAQVRH